jgi:carbon-monoxide dehydrogenase medium subunit
LGATIITTSREIPADSFFTGLFKTALMPGELIKAIRFPVPMKAGYAKFEQRASRYALIGVFAAQTAGGPRVAVTGSGASGVFRSAGLEAALAKGFTVDALKGATVPATGLLSDMHGGADYRASVIPVIAERAVTAAK